MIALFWCYSGSNSSEGALMIHWQYGSVGLYPTNCAIFSLVKNQGSIKIYKSLKLVLFMFQIMNEFASRQLGQLWLHTRMIYIISFNPYWNCWLYLQNPLRKTKFFHWTSPFKSKKTLKISLREFFKRITWAEVQKFAQSNSWNEWFPAE